MSLAEETWQNRSSYAVGSERGSLIMTTEDKGVFQMSKLFKKAVRKFPLDFIVNEEDSFQGSGNAQSFGQQADDIIISSLIAMQMQFHAGHVYGNCCSNFHVMMFDFLSEGCGLTVEHTCLQETKKYNVCCAWTPGEECQAIREDYKRSKETDKERLIREQQQAFARHIMMNKNTTM
jgi:hypothetical protein